MSRARAAVSLLAQVEQLQQRKAQLQQSNASQRQHLATLTSTVTSLYQSVTPLYATFFPSSDMQVHRPLPEKARELPMALWQLFCVGWSYCSAFVTDDSVTVHVMDADTKVPQKEERARDKAKEKDSVWTTHPLCVVLRLTVDAAESLDLRFYYLPTLQLVSVLPVASTSSVTVENWWLLHELFPGDDGSVLESQHLSSLSSAVKQSVQSVSPAPASIGRLYQWCQRLCGLHQPNVSGPSDPTAPAVDVSLASVLLVVRQRLEQRPILAAQLAQHSFSPASTTSSPSFLVYSRQYPAAGGRVLSVEVELPHSYPVRPPRFVLGYTTGGSLAVDERRLRALEGELNSADMGSGEHALSRLLEQLERRWAEVI